MSRRLEVDISKLPPDWHTVGYVCVVKCVSMEDGRARARLFASEDVSSWEANGLLTCFAEDAKHTFLDENDAVLYGEDEAD